MKIIENIVSKIGKKLSGEDRIYLFFAGIFFLALLVEGLKFLGSIYTFERASILFLGISLLYISYKYQSSGNIGIFRRVDASKAIPNLLAFLFLGISITYIGLVICSFFFPIAYLPINIILLLVLASYALWKIYGGKIEISLPIYSFSEASFTKILIVGGGFTFIFLNTLSQNYSLIGQDKGIFILLFLALSLILQSLLFSRVFQNISHFFVSGELITFLKKNIQITLSLALFFVSSLFILFKFGAFDFLFVKKIEHIAEFVPQSQNRVIEQEEKMSEQKLIGEIYTLSTPLSLGQTGESVRLLQEVLQKLGTYSQNITSIFDEYTRETLRTTLIEKCDWPETTQGIFGPQAKACLDGLEIEVEN